MKIAERIVMVGLFLCIVAGATWLYVAVQHEEKELRDAVARGDFQKPDTEDEVEFSPDDWRAIYPNTVPIVIGSTTMQASVADTLPKRILGLSGTPFLPDHVVKLFVFGSGGPQSIWMKDMNYPLDILWLDEDGDIVHIEENVSPDTYSRDNPRASKSFESPVPAWYVIEANAGFVASTTIAVGDKVQLAQ